MLWLFFHCFKVVVTAGGVAVLWFLSPWCSFGSPGQSHQQQSVLLADVEERLVRPLRWRNWPYQTKGLRWANIEWELYKNCYDHLWSNFVWMTYSYLFIICNYLVRQALSYFKIWTFSNSGIRPMSLAWSQPHCLTSFWSFARKMSGEDVLWAGLTQSSRFLRVFLFLSQVQTTLQRLVSKRIPIAGNSVSRSSRPV